jgi:lactoylglutathione lyase
MIHRLRSLRAMGWCLLIALPYSMAKDAPRQDTKAEHWSLKMVTPIETGVVCVDIDRMLRFYVDGLGLKQVSDAQASAEMSRKFGATPDGFRIVRLQTPHGERIKLVRPGKVAVRQSADPRYVFERQGTTYISFVIANIQDVAKHLKEQHVPLMSPDPVEVRKGVIALFAQDPEGNFVEFVEYTDVASYRPDLFR